MQSAAPPQSGPGMADLFAAFAAGENAAGGRPFLDSVEIDMGRAAREQMADLNLWSACDPTSGKYAAYLVTVVCGE